MRLVHSAVNGMLTVRVEPATGIMAELTHFQHWSSWRVERNGERIGYGTHTSGLPGCDDAHQVAVNWITRILHALGYTIPVEVL